MLVRHRKTRSLLSLWHCSSQCRLGLTREPSDLRAPPNINSRLPFTACLTNRRMKGNTAANLFRRQTAQPAVMPSSPMQQSNSVPRVFLRVFLHGFWQGIGAVMWGCSMLVPVFAQTNASPLVPPASITTFEQMMNSALLPLLLANAAMLLMVLLVFSFRQQHHRLPSLLVRFIQSQTTPYWIADHNGIVQHGNPALTAHYPWQQGAAISLYYDAEGLQPFWSHLQRLGLGDAQWQGLVYLRHNDNTMACHALKVTQLRAHPGDHTAPLLCQLLPEDMHASSTGAVPHQLLDSTNPTLAVEAPAIGVTTPQALHRELLTPNLANSPPSSLLIFIHTDGDLQPDLTPWLSGWRGFSDSQLSLEEPPILMPHDVSMPTFSLLKLSRQGPELPLLPLAIMLESLRRPCLLAALDQSTQHGAPIAAASFRPMYQRFAEHIRHYLAAKSNPLEPSATNDGPYSWIAVATEGEPSAWTQEWIARLTNVSPCHDLHHFPPTEPSHVTWQAHFKVLQALLQRVQQQPVLLEYQKCYHLERGLVQRFHSRWQWPRLDVSNSPRLRIAMTILQQLLPEQMGMQASMMHHSDGIATASVPNALDEHAKNARDVTAETLFDTSIHAAVSPLHAPDYAHLCQFIRCSTWWLHIERRAFEQLCQQQLQWQQQHLPVPILAWQWSAGQLLTHDFVPYLMTVLAEYETKPLDWHWCWREDDLLATMQTQPMFALSQLPSMDVVPDSSVPLSTIATAMSRLVRDNASARLQSALQHLSDAGHCIVLDEFAEHAGQLELLQWPVFRRVRFAARFSEQLEYSERIRHLNASLIRMASYLRLDVDVTAVPNEMTAYLLHVMGAQLGSGRYFSAWLDEDGVVEWLRQEQQQPQRLTG